MKPAPYPDNEQIRIRKLRELDILDTLEEQAYDDLTFLAAQICNTPIALVSLIDSDRQWFKSHFGLDARETPRDIAFCAHAILSDEVMVVEDADKDDRFYDNPLATDAPHVKFYAGAPLIFNDDIHLGTLCVIDNKARTITPEQKQSLQSLARQVVSQLELRLKLREMKHLDQAKDEFLAMVSHELRTPLTSIYGSLGLLQHQAVSLPEQTRQMLDIAYRNGGRLLNIVNDILDLAKLEAGKFEIDDRIIDPVALVQRAVELNQAYCEQCDCMIQLEPPVNGETLRVHGDEQRLLQVLANLISNAAKFTRKDDTIIISVTGDKESVCIKVTDHGKGLTEKQQEHLFEKFKQAGSNGDQKLPGTGLGLNICKHIIELHHGTIACKSVPNNTTSFYFTLPVINDTFLTDT
jgi:signal transduction histidine kinase